MLEFTYIGTECIFTYIVDMVNWASSFHKSNFLGPNALFLTKVRYNIAFYKFSGFNIKGIGSIMSFGLARH